MKATKTTDVGSFFQGFIDEGRAKFGDDRILVGSQEEETQRGLLLPSFALQYIFHSNILPMGKIIGMAGATKSLKSGYLFEIMKWAMEAGGIAHLVETENKFNPHFFMSIVGHDKQGRYRIDQVKTVQQAQDSVSQAISYYQEHCPNNDLPLVIGVDSLAGNTTDDIRDEIKKTGHAEKAYPESALLWTNYFKVLCSDIIGTPIIIGFTNHLKDKIDSTGGAKVKTKSCGVAQDFHAAQYLYMNKILDIGRVDREGKLIGIKSEKCGLGPDNRRIEVPVLWDFETKDAEGHPLQRTTWDWHAGTAKLLVDKSLPKRVAAVSDLTCNANRYSSKRLGMVRVEDFEIGEAIFKDQDYMKDLQNACGFRQWGVFGHD